MTALAHSIPLDYYANSGLFNAVTTAGIIALVLIKRPSSRLAHRLVAFATVFFCWSAFYYLWLCETHDPRRAELLLRSCMVAVTLMPATFADFAVQLVGWRRQYRRFIAGNYLLSIFFALSVWSPLYAHTPERFLVFPFWLKPGPLFPFQVAHFVGSMVFAHWLIYRKLRHSTGHHREQLLWVLGGFATGIMSGSTNFLVWFRVPIPPVLTPLASVHVACVAYAILQHQFLDIKVVIRRSLVYSLLIGCMTASYLVGVLLIERFCQGVIGYRSVVGTLAASFLIAIFFNPLRARIQAFVDKAVFHGTPEELATEREHLLAEVRRTEHMRVVSTLAAGLAHEIKNPLTAIKTFTEHLEMKHEDAQFRQKFQRIVGGEIDRIHDIVQQLLEYAKPRPPRLQPLRPWQLAHETLELLEGELVKHQIAVECAGDRECEILGDREQLKQVLVNLILNAMDAITASGRIAVYVAVDGGQCVVTIVDTGKGIDAAELAQLFKPFMTSKGNGTGLGLAVVKSIVEEHHGTIHVSSQPGQGTRVVLQFPSYAGQSA